MDVILVTGSAGLIGSEAVEFFSNKFDHVIGIDNDFRAKFFGKEASVDWNRKRLESKILNYKHFNLDIRDYKALEKVFSEYNNDIKLIIHAAAQPSHDWAATNPMLDFSINANGTLNLLELTRKHSQQAVFIFTSTNKVYGDKPNFLPLIEKDTRWEIDENHPYYENGIDELMSIDQSKHSLFGSSKIAADIITQEYGHYYGMKTGTFRGGCLTGPNHSGTQLHGFLSFLMKCSVTGEHYTIFGYKGKQVRDNIHSWDFINMLWHYYQNPRQGEVYNAGGGRYSNCSILEAIKLCEEITGNKVNYSYSNENLIGYHIWWIIDLSKFKSHYKDWELKYDLKKTLIEIHDSFIHRVKLR
ncbi:MAG: NAD-dependent epimerase/dehydratase family protein [Thermodesulfobacteriota bacterium]